MLEASERVQRLQSEVDRISEAGAEAEAEGETEEKEGKPLEDVPDLITLESPQANTVRGQFPQLAPPTVLEESHDPTPTARDSTLEPMSQELF